MSDDPENSNRRQFLKGQSAADALRSKIESIELDAAKELSDARQTGYLEQYTKKAMGCEFEFLFNLHQYAQSGASAMEGFQLVDLLEDQMTVYRDHSEISRLNHEAFGAAIKVESRLFELLSLAEQIYHQTGHAFDITSTPLTSAWGFDTRNGSVPKDAAIEEALSLVGSEFIELDPQSRTFRFLKHGVNINLGGIGKGHALDRVAELFASHQIGDFVIHGGQSSVLAKGASMSHESPRGTASNNPTEDAEEDLGSHVSGPVGAQEDQTSKANSNPKHTHDGWEVGLSHPTLPGVRLAEVTLRNQALGTSGSGRQGFFHQGKRLGHIIDPRTGWPTTHFLSTTVISNSAALSDALATAFFVMSTDEVAEFCEATPAVAAILISANEKRKGPLKIETFNLPDENFHQVNE